MMSVKNNTQVVKGSRCNQQYTQCGCNSECGKDCPCLNNSPAVKSIVGMYYEFKK
ncbi:hypothetical protein HanRHA438_Chr17g0803231 [Helianthus annuus]|uniref:Uncharacterized protein n=1 Tax=Helianthus annuus TaxID=4232 RepID=A0A9K3DH81_HELAN|nr:hypothetical protein HanXRQr2_Chr17g0793041 [Helianthus annuus]KAJ0428457.1 hypothetical protein HanHA300_Chr17g0646341 [Helianthus annuus]KAJ0432548.1 hypothetical protein HanIR_Chr17g0860441 [Helianthus annuus]KAJ0446797.1 hypothetical protein HanHA89_Chr17g0698241 [Helianthus annuus]KAJ0631691.1 hypothetical protein HanLR1_Chr17g0656791 [Helianthus annuus]